MTTENKKIDDENDEDPITFVVVVGMNRVRLQKIMGIVDEELQQQKRQHIVEKVKFVPCVASFGQYKEEDTGRIIKYLMNVTRLDNTCNDATMKEHFDDDNFRLNLSNDILLVGYEWDNDNNNDQQQQIQNFFIANGFADVQANCVKPNNEFMSLKEEMEHFKNLTEEEKRLNLSKKTMGPGKMAKFILDETITELSTTTATTTTNTSSSCSNIEDEGEITTTTTASVLHEEGNDDNDDDGSNNIENIKASQQIDYNDYTDDGQQDQLQQPASTTTRRPPPPLIPITINPSKPRYACRMCRTILFREVDLADGHAQSLHSFTNKNRHLKKASTSGSCQSIFCSEIVLDWLTNPTETEDYDGGKLVCPKCNYKLGHYKWSGSQCSCGTWVTPSIQIPLSKIDRIIPEVPF